MSNYFDQNMKAKKLPMKQQKSVNFHLPELPPSVKESFPPKESNKTVLTRQMSNGFQNKSAISKISCKNLNLQPNPSNIIINNNFTNHHYKQISSQPTSYVGSYGKTQSSNSDSCNMPHSTYFRDPANDFSNRINSAGLIHNSTKNTKQLASCSFPIDIKHTRSINISSAGSTKPKSSYWSSNVSNQSYSYNSSPFSSRSITPVFSEASFSYDDFGKHCRFETIFENNTIRRTNDYNSSNQNNDTKSTTEEDKSIVFKKQSQPIVSRENKIIFSNNSLNSGNLMDMNTSYASSHVTDNETLNNKQETEVKKGHVRDHLDKFENMIGSGHNVIISPSKSGKFLHRKNKQLPSQRFCSDYLGTITNNCFDHNNTNHYHKNSDYDRFKKEEDFLKNNSENDIKVEKHNFTSSINHTLAYNSKANSVETPPHSENAFGKNCMNDSSIIKNQFRNGYASENVPVASETGNLKENCSGQERPRAKSLATNLLYPHRPYAAQPYIEISSSVKKQPKQTEKKLSNNVEKPYKGGEDKKKVFETRKEQKFLKNTSVESSSQSQKYLPIIYTNAKSCVNGVEDEPKNNERTISDSEVTYQQNKWKGNKTSNNFDNFNNELDDKRNLKYKEEKQNIRLKKLDAEEQRLRLRQLKDKQKKSVQRSSIYFQTSNNASATITPSCRAKVLFTFVPQRPNELALKKGEVVTILRKINSNWFKGKIGGQVGVFPSNYVQVLVCKDEQLDNEAKESLAVATHNFIGRTPLELSIEKGDEVVLVRKIDDYWFEGRLNGKQGLFPASYVEVINPLPSVVSKEFSSSSRSNSVASNAPQLPSPWDSDFYESEVDQHENASLPRNSSSYLSTKNFNSYESAIETSKSQDDTDNRIKKQTYFNFFPTFEREKKCKVDCEYLKKNAINDFSLANQHKNPAFLHDKYTKVEDPLFISSQEIIQRLKSKVIDKYKAVFSYKAQNDDEMSLRQGEVVSVVEKCADGWYVGFKERNKQFGTFPGNYVRML